MKDKVSIITTFYNAEEFIETAVKSVINQKTDDNFDIEYIIVDDVSPDKSKKIVQDCINELKPSFSYKIVTPEKNLGCGGARRFGIENATGDYFMFLDADDYYISDTFVQRAYTTIKQNRADVVEYGLITRQVDGTPVKNVVPKNIVIDNNPREVLLTMFRDNMIRFNVWTKICTRQIVETYPYSDERTFEDVRTTPIWLSNAKRVIIMNTAEINYRSSENSIIRTDIYKTRLGTIAAIASLFERFKDDNAVLVAMYGRAMVDLEAVLSNHSSENTAFNEMSRLNTEMLKYIYPDTWKDITYNIDDEENNKEKCQ